MAATTVVRVGILTKSQVPSTKTWHFDRKRGAIRLRKVVHCAAVLLIPCGGWLAGFSVECAGGVCLQWPSVAGNLA